MEHFKVTQKFTAGPLQGLEHTSVTCVAYTVGQVESDTGSGSSYEITAVTPILYTLPLPDENYPALSANPPDWACQKPSTPLLRAIRLLGRYTSNRFDVWGIAGGQNAAVRARLMTELKGVKVPQSKSGVTAIEEEFYAVCGITGNCGAERQENFREYCRNAIAA
jgi:hypothetical protein